ncbi:hypothetical protein [Candidatus Blastococcus massiliensis]|uniref:hypothetical protein n=1 Tax=Candidatus Blastococcus massiliensis TaxID=1470358 RepID=UPI0004B73A29|nr:hypothetical protein [Candidatus Blastococcus massiliensis]
MSAPTPRRPAEMSLAEKLACEREARHDVLARGRSGDLAPVQHYCAHLRCEDARHPPAGHRTPSHTRLRPVEHDRTVSPALRHWLRWGEEGAAGERAGPG